MIDFEILLPECEYLFILLASGLRVRNLKRQDIIFLSQFYLTHKLDRTSQVYANIVNSAFFHSINLQALHFEDPVFVLVCIQRGF
jgi:hypothetical protein